MSSPVQTAPGTPDFEAVFNQSADLVLVLDSGFKGAPDQRKVQWTFRPANAAAVRVHTRREAGRKPDRRAPDHAVSTRQMADQQGAAP